MAKNDYTYDNGKTRKGRVNVWELEKRVKKLETQIQIISRHINHQAELNKQQVLLNETLSDRVALLEKASWSKQGMFGRWLSWVQGK
jgi:raw score 10.02|nr:MAG TPA: zipper dimerization domain transcription factor-like protein [Caudoviricetes sp.]DAN42014.1 MAG TPA: zipper dimerization domain transcription factor-like protein [Caudoviricetes sp.]